MWEPLTIDEFAHFAMANGTDVVNVDGVWWKKVRPFFYRQLYPFQVLTGRSVKGPWASYFGGNQYSVPSREIANSFLNLRVFDDIQSYSIMSLDKNRRRQIKKGSHTISIRPISMLKEFQDDGYQVYMSFYNRTQYSFNSERRKKDNFAKWAEAVYTFPKIRVLGGYEKEKLCAVSLSYLVEDVIFYATYFSLTEYLNACVSDLMLHAIRETAASYSSVRYIYTGMYSGEKGVNDFYFLRGSKLIKQPAFYRVNPLLLFLTRNLMKEKYLQLTGFLEDDVVRNDSNQALSDQNLMSVSGHERFNGDH